MTFVERLEAAWRSSGSLLCVGLDPDPARLPVPLLRHPRPLFELCRQVADATADLVCAFKPQFAHFAACGAEDELAALIAHLHDAHPHVPVILDAKRGDIGSTAERYAREAFERYAADAVTVNPYLGGDALAPFLDWPERGVLVLCRTSNPGGADLQARPVGGVPLYERVAHLTATEWNPHGQTGLVVGATVPVELARVRAIVGGLPILVPGVGAQGGDPAAAVRAGASPDGTGLVVNSARAILHASGGDDFATAARAVAVTSRDALLAATGSDDLPA